MKLKVPKERRKIQMNERDTVGKAAEKKINHLCWS